MSGLNSSSINICVEKARKWILKVIIRLTQTSEVYLFVRALYVVFLSKKLSLMFGTFGQLWISTSLSAWVLYLEWMFCKAWKCQLQKRKAWKCQLLCWVTNISDSISAAVSGFRSAERKLFHCTRLLQHCSTIWLGQGRCRGLRLSGVVFWGFRLLLAVLFCKAFHVVWFHAGSCQVSWLEKQGCYLINKCPQQTEQMSEWGLCLVHLSHR